MKLSFQIKKDDRVTVLAGKDKGKTGKVLRVLSGKNRVVVEKINMIKRHSRPSQTNKGGIIEKEGPIHVSNLQVICPKCADPARLGKKVLEDGSRVRVCRKCGEVIDG
jgi:large subunit ribosomal protein L24